MVRYRTIIEELTSWISKVGGGVTVELTADNSLNQEFLLSAVVEDMRYVETGFMWYNYLSLSSFFIPNYNIVGDVTLMGDVEVNC